jgi:hypothetical protein
MKRIGLLLATVIVLATLGWFLYRKFQRTTQTHIDFETYRKVTAEYDSDGKLDGQTFAYQYKKLVASAEFKHGLKDGISVMYFPNGRKKSISHWAEDKEEGLRTVYYQNGKIRSIENWSSGKLYGNTYLHHPNGKLRCYNARDIDETVFYTYEVNKTGNVLRNYGQVFSKNLYTKLGDSIIILENGHRYNNIKDLFIAVSSPPGTSSDIKALVNNTSELVVRIDSNTYRIANVFRSNTNYMVQIVGKHLDRNLNIIRVDSLSTSILVD